MAIDESILWQAGNQGRYWWRWSVWTVVIALAVYGGLLWSDSGEPVHGYLLAGGAALVAVAGVAYWVWDRTRVVEIKLLDGSPPVLGIRTVTGRVDRVAPQDVTRLHMICTYGPYDPDSHGEADTRDSDNVLLLELHHGRRRYRGRPTAYMRDAHRNELWAAWQRLCPQATAKRETRFRTPGTND
ncbi:hypothetical protein [Catellatospora citrea]|uniref:Uncharacterized protein n=1 Tax=Catellatospora citrea TaxID=53366 RepID=A0A8J3K9V5_9ACTN|nr:hypothetical protein [Catellatospora citrea]RKE12788.1 hypothetical protein C8E86_7732 [Catellatospora citrea]GIF95971.1 hypothetical protein Cci01nite_10650 [Catellatospora citrea]